MKASEFIETERLILRRPVALDAEAIFANYASDPEVTRYLAWPRHESVEQTRKFISSSDDQWQKCTGGPYIIESREPRLILGGTGYVFNTPFYAGVGYVLAKDAWGNGYATEALRAVIETGINTGIRFLYAHCHPDNKASIRVLQKCGFVLEDTFRNHPGFPNLVDSRPRDVLYYSLTFS